MFISNHLKSNEITIIDIGAHRGDFIDNIKKHFNILSAVLIEPIPELAKYLSKKYESDFFHIIQNVVTDQDFNSKEFHINEFGETSSILKIRKEMTELSDINTRVKETIKVTTRTLDSIVSDLRLNKIDLVKIDVQGAEHLVLKGSEKSLKLTSFVWIEMSLKPLYKGSSVFHDIYEIMEKYGFALLELSPGHRSATKELLQVDALFINKGA